MTVRGRGRPGTGIEVEERREAEMKAGERQGYEERQAEFV